MYSGRRCYRAEARDPLMRVLAAVLVVATLFYVMTGLVYQEGGFGAALVIKPHPMLQPSFSGGEEGAWARHHPGSERPWFQRGAYVELHRFDWEYAVPRWVTAYLAGYLLTPLAWLGFGVFGIFKFLKRQRTRQGRV